MKFKIWQKNFCFYLVFGKNLNLLWQICCAIGRIFIVVNGQNWAYHLVIWSHWSATAAISFLKETASFKELSHFFLMKFSVSFFQFFSLSLKVDEASGQHRAFHLGNHAKTRSSHLSPANRSLDQRYKTFGHLFRKRTSPEFLICEVTVTYVIMSAWWALSSTRWL